jgi:hypothetical protein
MFIVKVNGWMDLSPNNPSTHDGKIWGKEKNKNKKSDRVPAVVENE